ncbi:MAG: hypothetical protein JWO66_2201, partial [Candidatus Eremiobacteraeota bacterium]|nr:hypothetical protein [Candidatus Eremiobacteraeota bacterium]
RQDPHRDRSSADDPALEAAYEQLAGVHGVGSERLKTGQQNVPGHEPKVFSGKGKGPLDSPNRANPRLSGESYGRPYALIGDSRFEQKKPPPNGAADKVVWFSGSSSLRSEPSDHRETLFGTVASNDDHLLLSAC